jgi:hypothetical protein
VSAVLTVVVGVLGIGLGALLARRNERASTTDRLLTEALNDLVAAIAHVANGEGQAAQGRYASATSRIALHASPPVVAAFRRFQDDATTGTPDGRARLLDAIHIARRELGQKPADTDDLETLLFGPGGKRLPPELR